MADEREQTLAAQLRRGVEYLGKGRIEAAIAALQVVCLDPEFASAEDLRDIRARALSLWGDALIRAGQLEEAEPPIRESLALLAELGDKPGRAEVHRLWEALQAARQERGAASRRGVAAARLRQLDVAELEERFAGPQLADALIKKANAEIDGGDSAAGLALAERALALARAEDALREEVFALLSVARSDQARAPEALQQAWSRAERAGEFTLVGAVARAAEIQGVPLAVQHGPDMGWRSREDRAHDDDPNDQMG